MLGDWVVVGRGQLVKIGEKFSAGGGESPLTHPPKMGGRVHAKQQPHPPENENAGRAGQGPCELGI